MSKTGQGTYDLILRGIKILEHVKTSYHVRSTLTAKSPPPSEIINNFKKIGFKNIFIGIVTPSFLFENRELSPVDAEKIANNLFDTFLESNRNCENIIYNNINEIIRQILSPCPRKSCGVSKAKIAIKHDGTIFPCHRFVNSPDLCSGNVTRGVNNKYYNLYSTVVEKNENCRKCELRIIYCGGTCFFEINRRKNINYCQDDMCLFHKTLFFRTLKTITHLYLNDKNKYHSLVSSCKIEEINQVEIENIKITKKYV